MSKTSVRRAIKAELDHPRGTSQAIWIIGQQVVNEKVSLTRIYNMIDHVVDAAEGAYRIVADTVFPAKAPAR